jgi:hypothetical protein
VPALLPRRRLLLASATTLPLLLATAGCRSSDAFTGPDPLAGRPRPSTGVITLQAVIAAEEELVRLYRTAVSSPAQGAPGPALLKPLLAQHEQHLAQLKARLLIPSGSSPAASPSPAATGTSSPGPVTASRLRAAERASVSDLVAKLAAVPPSLAQLFASIAASDATHVTALGG